MTSTGAATDAARSPAGGHGARHAARARTALAREAARYRRRRVDLFATHRIDGTGMRELAAASGASTATIYAHFPTKHEPMQALIDERWQAALTRMVKRAATWRWRRG